MQTHPYPTARRFANALAFDAADHFHYYVCQVPGSKKFAVVSETQYSEKRHAGLIGRAVYVQNGRGARLEAGQ